jgi:hypothetical protein
MKTFKQFIFENKYQDQALDNLSKNGGSFYHLPDIDKLTLLSDTNDTRQLKNLSFTDMFKELGGTLGYLKMKVKVLPVSEQSYNDKQAQEKANQTGYLFPYFHYDENKPYVTVRFNFIPNKEMKGGGTYEDLNIYLVNIYPIGFDDTPQEFISYNQKVEAERKEFLDNWKGFDGTPWDDVLDDDDK